MLIIVEQFYFVWYNNIITRYGGIILALQESGEMYLESIYVLSKKGGIVRSVDVCEYMGYSKPSVSRAVGLLKKGGYITVSEDGGLHLTEVGYEVSQKIYERHTIITEFLVKAGVSREVAVEDACKMEHVIFDQTLEVFKKFVK